MPDNQTKGYLDLITRSGLPEQTKEDKPLQENVRYWALVTQDGLDAVLFTNANRAHERLGLCPKGAGHRLIQVTLKEVPDA